MHGDTGPTQCEGLTHEVVDAMDAIGCKQQPVEIVLPSSETMLRATKRVTHHPGVWPIGMDFLRLKWFPQSKPVVPPGES